MTRYMSIGGQKDRFSQKYKIKNGIIVKPKNDIKVSDIPNR